MDIGPYGLQRNENEFYEPKVGLTGLQSSGLKILQPYQLCLSQKGRCIDKLKGVWAFILNLLTCGGYKRGLQKKIESLQAIEACYEKIDNNLCVKGKSEGSPEHTYEKVIEGLERKPIKSCRLQQLIDKLPEDLEKGVHKMVASFESLSPKKKVKIAYEKLLKKIIHCQSQGNKNYYDLQDEIELFFAKITEQEGNDDKKLNIIRSLALHLDVVSTLFQPGNNLKNCEVTHDKGI